MALVTFSMKDIVNASMANRAAEVFFQLNEPGVATVGSNAGTVYPTEVQSVKSGASGSMSIDLQTTTSMLHDAYYTMRLEWLDGKSPGKDFPGWQLRVPVGGGRLDQLVTLGPPSGGGWGGSLPNLSVVLMGLTLPENLQVGQYWWKTDPNDPNNVNGKNTGQILEGVR